MINVSSEHLRKQLEENLESIVDYTLQMESSSIPHPVKSFTIIKLLQNILIN